MTKESRTLEVQNFAEAINYLKDVRVLEFKQELEIQDLLTARDYKAKQEILAAENEDLEVYKLLSKAEIYGIYYSIEDLDIEQLRDDVLVWEELLATARRLKIDHAANDYDPVLLQDLIEDAEREEHAQDLSDKRYYRSMKF